MNPGDGPREPAYAPPRWLRNPHLQTVLGSGPWRRRRAAAVLARTGAVTREHLLDGGDGVRLLGLHSAVPGTRPRGLALLLHGWEGSAMSSYMQLAAAQLLGRGFEVFRLNFRDHGDTHHLNPEIFHSCRIDEVVHAACDVAARFSPRPLVVAGYSLGGNFALRLALRAQAAGLPLARVAAVCPVVDPAGTMRRMEQGPWFYMHYFERKWRGSLARKRALFPDSVGLDGEVLKLRMRPLTEWLVLRHTPLGSIDNYFDGYSVAGDRLAALPVPTNILMSADDPVIPSGDFQALSLPAHARLEILPWGGHCAFLDGRGAAGHAERWLAARLVGE